MITVPHSAPAAQQVSTSVPVNSAYVVNAGQGNWRAGQGDANTMLAKAG